MLDHVSIEVRDLEQSKAFFLAVLAPLGGKLVVDLKQWGAAGFGMDRPTFWIGGGKPTHGEDEVHVCFAAKSRAQVIAFHEAALKAGGRDNGKPGLRAEYHPNYFGAFVFDPDGNNIEACCHLPE